MSDVSIRSAAIIGPTPETIYWSIARPCALRQIKDRDFPESSFRQLRSLRELSYAISTDRVLGDIALHPAAKSQEPEQLLGFVISEIERAYGGRTAIQLACEGCPANAPTGWAGCAGIVPLWNQLPGEGLDWIVSRFNDLIADPGNRQDFEKNFVETKPAWYGLWTQSPLTKIQSRLLVNWFSRMEAGIHNKRGSDDVLQARDFQNDFNSAFSSMSNAMRRATEYDLPFHVEYKVSGVSDGTYWTLPPHCQRCKLIRTESEGHCPRCGIRGHVIPGQRRRVLGIRPYLHLQKILGLEKTKAMVALINGLNDQETAM